MGERHMSLIFCKTNDSYYELDSETKAEVIRSHVDDLRPYERNTSHLITTGFNGAFDQVVIVEGDSLDDIYQAARIFRAGAKARHIELVDVVFGIKVDDRVGFAEKHGG